MRIEIGAVEESLGKEWHFFVRGEDFLDFIAFFEQFNHASAVRFEGGLVLSFWACVDLFGEVIRDHEIVRVATDVGETMIGENGDGLDCFLRVDFRSVIHESVLHETRLDVRCADVVEQRDRCRVFGGFRDSVVERRCSVIMDKSEGSKSSDTGGLRERNTLAQ